jgi:hypothetical protein
MRIANLLLLLVIGCGNGETEKTVDTAPAGPCVGATYEVCTDNTQCSSQNCRLFKGDGIQICTATCDANNPCPDFNGQPVACNAMSVCKSPGETVCTR